MGHVRKIGGYHVAGYVLAESKYERALGVFEIVAFEYLTKQHRGGAFAWYLNADGGSAGYGRLDAYG